METPLIFTPVTAFYAGLLATFYVYLSVIVIAQRKKKQIGIGDADDRHMQQVIRVHANFFEYVPFAVLLMLIAEINHTDHLWLHIAGVALIAARMLHAYGLRHSSGVSWQRAVGVVTTFSIYALLIALNLLVVY
mgnify:CR=1 FL=1